jgi:hypothetical protein
MTTPTEIGQRNHDRAVRFFWGFLIGATTISLLGNVTHAALRYLPRLIVQVGAAAVPPIALLAAVHGIALAVRAGASGRIYAWAVTAVAAIGAGAFSVSFLALRDLMRAIGYSPATACVFPAIIDTTVAVSTMMLVALGDKPAHRSRTVVTSANVQTAAMKRMANSTTQSAKAQVTPSARASARVQTPGLVQPRLAQTAQNSVQTGGTQFDADLAMELIASRTTTQPVETVVAVLAASRDGVSINAAAKASGINYRTAQRIVEAAAKHRQRDLAVVS